MSGFRGINGASPLTWGPLHLFHVPTLHARPACHPNGAGKCLCDGRGRMRQSTVGPPQRLSRNQIRIVMHWHRQAVLFRRTQGTLASLASSLGLSVHELRRALTGDLRGLALSPQQRRQIKRWEARRRRFKAQHPSARSLAQSLNVSRSTLFLCIQKKGSYRNSSSRKPATRRGAAKLDAIAMRSSLLNSWGRVRVTD
jgi:hypothetical protein